MLPKELLYSKEHEWVRIDGDEAVIGITEHAQEQLGDVVYVELPPLQAQVQQFQPLGVIESVKAASDIFAPVSGEVIATNEALSTAPERVNGDPYGEGWMVRVKVADRDELGALLSAEGYEKLLEGE